MTRCPTTGKVRYRDQHDATLALRKAGRSRAKAQVFGMKSKRQEKRSYLCPSCRGFHLTSQKD